MVSKMVWGHLWEEIRRGGFDWHHHFVEGSRAQPRPGRWPLSDWVGMDTLVQGRRIRVSL